MNIINFSTMLIFRIFYLIIIFCVDAGNFATIAGEAPRWDYKNQEKWTGVCQTGSFQSPVNLDASSSIQYRTISPLALRNVGYFHDVVVGNNGHTVTVSLDCPKSAKPNISGALLLESYILDSMHFHWPSEHTINGKYYDLEAHLVFYDQRHSDLNAALLEPFAISVVGILFQAIADAAKNVARRVGQSAPVIKGINLGDLFPNDIQKFFTYNGSLTTPPCTETVTWFVMRDTPYILQDDLARISRIYTEEGEQLRCINRKRQKLNGRAIFAHNFN
ncbi:carbonic anhydrase 6-like isoform X2 [Euwallacea fornicatus]|uniref:carbonic anhydrase 6-like isoform X2 n=1 Tax=Euwallacea fornicatus TaxID=995702 RepID=UPI00338FC66E